VRACPGQGLRRFAENLAWRFSRCAFRGAQRRRHPQRSRFGAESRGAALLVCLRFTSPVTWRSVQDSYRPAVRALTGLDCTTGFLSEVSRAS